MTFTNTHGNKSWDNSEPVVIVASLVVIILPGILLGPVNYGIRGVTGATQVRQVPPAHPRHGLFPLGPFTQPWAQSHIPLPHTCLPSSVPVLYLPSFSSLSLCLFHTVSVSPCLFSASPPPCHCLSVAHAGPRSPCFGDRKVLPDGVQSSWRLLGLGLPAALRRMWPC